jgi:hypothetical protein
VPPATFRSARSLAPVATVAVLLCAPAPAPATHYDNMFPTGNTSFSTCADSSPGGPFCQTDNATLTVHRQSSLSAASKDNIAWTLNNSWDTTDLNVSYDSTPAYSGTAETDIVYQRNDAAVEAGKDGIAWCNDAVSTFRCDQHYVAFDLATAPRALACHETGHAVGLTHGNNANPTVDAQASSLECMRNPLTYSGADNFVGAHNANWVNATY